jgi:hypothetical protein
VINQVVALVKVFNRIRKQVKIVFTQCVNEKSNMKQNDNNGGN